MFSINENEYTQMTDEKLIENIKRDQNFIDKMNGHRHPLIK